MKKRDPLSLSSFDLFLLKIENQQKKPYDREETKKSREKATRLDEQRRILEYKP